MSVAILNPNQFWQANLMVPTTQKVILDFEAGGFAHLYVLDQAELIRFNTGDRNFPMHAGPLQTYHGPIAFSLPAGTMWYLVIVNENNAQIPIFYRVYNSQ